MPQVQTGFFCLLPVIGCVREGEARDIRCLLPVAFPRRRHLPYITGEQARDRDKVTDRSATSPTDPDVPVSGIRLLKSWVRCAANC